MIKRMILAILAMVTLTTGIANASLLINIYRDTDMREDIDNQNFRESDMFIAGLAEGTENAWNKLFGAVSTKTLNIDNGVGQERNFGYQTYVIATADKLLQSPQVTKFWEISFPYAKYLTPSAATAAKPSPDK
ncbi:hypothetical protein [Oryzomonas rubra]|uniref:Uncharacterized protein n=1 Tax=Oryzomonas rubra TaxID=2509454 RepID=A0A5A9X4K0_9BACT|nr:hypothetical protein [Oryzomonas rubra]KAA0888072.1 hypothetical protein ET418_16870 [Oryzomonas rubra]